MPGEAPPGQRLRERRATIPRMPEAALPLVPAARPAYVYQLCPGLQEIAGVGSVPEHELIRALERCGAIVRVAAGAAEEEAAAPALPEPERQPSKPRPAGQLWTLAKRAAKGAPASDPWEVHRLWERPTELCVRHDYDPHTRTWHSMETLVKMEDQPFAHGAMRECFRLKKMSQFSPAFFFRMDWRHCANYVAKRYKSAEAGRQMYLDDVMMQMEAKRWSARYNALGPPKPVDFLQAFALEFPHRGGAVYAAERLIEGEYTKYNGNSGYVAGGAEHYRSTPQAFSLFTFHASAGRCMVVDIQGVGDVFTDPQVNAQACYA